MPTLTKKGQVTIPKPFREKLHIHQGDSISFEFKQNQLILKKKKIKSILNLGGVAKNRKVGSGDEREFAKRIVSKRISRKGLKNGRTNLC